MNFVWDCSLVIFPSTLDWSGLSQSLLLLSSACTQGFPTINLLPLVMSMQGGGALLVVRGSSSSSALLLLLTHLSGFFPNVFISWLRNLPKMDVHVFVFLVFWEVTIQFLNQSLAYTITQKDTKQVVQEIRGIMMQVWYEVFRCLWGQKDTFEMAFVRDSIWKGSWKAGALKTWQAFERQTWEGNGFLAEKSRLLKAQRTVGVGCVLVMVVGEAWVL